MRYVVVVHKDADSDYGVTVPDLPGCFSAGDTFDEALDNAVEAIECHVESLLIDGEPVPQPQTVETHQSDPDFQGGIFGVVDVDLSKISGKSRRINVTIPERILSQIDRYADSRGESRSGVLAAAALEYVACQSIDPYDKALIPQWNKGKSTDKSEQDLALC